MSTRILIDVEQDGRHRKYRITGGRLRALTSLAVLGALLAAVGAAGGAWYAHGAMGNGPAAVAENALLRTRLQELEARQASVDQALDRVMAYDSKIRQLTREDDGARAFGIGPLSALEIAAAEREGRGVALPGEDFQLGEPRSADLGGWLDDAEMRSEMLQTRLEGEEESLQEIRGYLDDRTSLLRAHPTVWPVRGWVTSGYGYRNSPHGGGHRLHAGLDIAAPRGTPVIAPADGHVVFAGYHSAYGNLVVVDHGYGITTKYAHLHRMHVRVGDRVQRGDRVAKVGNTGRSTGPHLHFEVHKDGVAVNPRRFLERR